MSTLKTLIAALAIAGLAGFAHAAPFTSAELGGLLAGYDFGTQNSADFQDSFVQQPNTTVSIFDATVSFNSSSRGAAFDAGPWTSSPSDTNDEGSGQTRANFTSSWSGDTTFQDAVDNGEYYSFSVTALSGNLLELAEIGFLIKRDAADAADSYSLWMSTDGFSGFTGTATANTTNIADDTITTVSAATSSDYGSTISYALSDTVPQAEFRFYIYGEDGASNASTRVDKVYLDGDVVIPEPASAALLGLAGVVLAGVRRRRV